MVQQETPETPTPTEDFALTSTVAAITQQAQYEADMKATVDAASTATEQAWQIEATVTAEALAFEATQKAQATLAAEAAEAAAIAAATATAQVRENNIQSFEFFDTFNDNSLNWRVEPIENNFWNGDVSISNGVYIWQVDAVKQDSLISWADFKPIEELRDFDVAFKARLVEGPIIDACYGIIFRSALSGFSDGSYILTICENGYYKVHYNETSDPWVDIINWTYSDTIRQGDWNLVELEARGDNFTLFINYQQVATFRDSRLESGVVSVMVHVFAETPCVIEYDLFALQPR